MSRHVEWLASTDAEVLTREEVIEWLRPDDENLTDHVLTLCDPNGDVVVIEGDLAYFDQLAEQIRDSVRRTTDGRMRPDWLAS